MTVKIKEIRYLVSPNESSMDLITVDHQRQAAFHRFIDKNYLGAIKWMLKWNNK